jgi:hypothetical protein
LDRNSKVEKEVLIDDASGRVRDEMTFIVGKTLEIGLICLEVDFLSSPDRSLRLLGKRLKRPGFSPRIGSIERDRGEPGVSAESDGQRRVGRMRELRSLLQKRWST